MKDYSKLTKQELIELIDVLEQEKRNLTMGVEEKDLEVAKAKKAQEVAIETAKKPLELELEALKNQKKDSEKLFNRDIEDVRKEYEEKLKAKEETIHAKDEEIKQNKKRFQELLEKIVGQREEALIQFGNVLKQLSGLTEASLYINEKMIESFNR